MDNRNTALKTISNWTKDELLECLAKNNLSYCTDAVQNHEIDGAQFLEATEHKVIFWGIPRQKRREVLQFIEDFRKFPEKYVKNKSLLTYPVQHNQNSSKRLPSIPFQKPNIERVNTHPSTSYRNLDKDTQKEPIEIENSKTQFEKQSIDKLAFQLNTILRVQFPDTFNKHEPVYENISIYFKNKKDLWKSDNSDNLDYNENTKHFHNESEENDGDAEYYEFPPPIENDTDQNETNQQLDTPILPPRPNQRYTNLSLGKSQYDSFDTSSSEDLSIDTQPSTAITPDPNIKNQHSLNILPPKPINIVSHQSNLSTGKNRLNKNEELPSRLNKPQINDSPSFPDDDIDFSISNKKKFAADLEAKFKNNPNFSFNLKNTSTLHSLPKPPPIRKNEFQKNDEKIKPPLQREALPIPFNHDSNIESDNEEENLYEVEPITNESVDYIEPIQHNIPVTSRPLPPKPTSTSPMPGLPQSLPPTKPLPPRPPHMTTASITSWPLPKPPVEVDEWLTNMDRLGAENYLLGRSNGTFIFRPSSKENYLHTLSLIFEQSVYHIPVVKIESGRIMLGLSKNGEHTFADLKQLVEFYRQEKLALFRNGVNTGSVYLRNTNM